MTKKLEIQINKIPNPKTEETKGRQQNSKGKKSKSKQLQTIK